MQMGKVGAVIEREMTVCCVGQCLVAMSGVLVIGCNRHLVAVLSRLIALLVEANALLAILC